MKNILYENMRRFSTKNLREQNDDAPWRNDAEPPAGNPFEFTSGIHELEPREVYQRLRDREGLYPGTTITPEEISDVLRHADGLFNDKEAYIQSAFAAIKDANELKQVFEKCGKLGCSPARSPIDYLFDVFSSYKELSKDYHGNGKVPVIAQSIKRLGIDPINLPTP